MCINFVFGPRLTYLENIETWKLSMPHGKLFGEEWN